VKDLIHIFLERGIDRRSMSWCHGVVTTLTLLLIFAIISWATGKTIQYSAFVKCVKCDIMHDSIKNEAWSSLPTASHLQSSGPRRSKELKRNWRELRKLKEASIDWWKLILKGWYWLWGAENDVHVCSMNTDFVWMGVWFRPNPTLSNVYKRLLKIS